MKYLMILLLVIISLFTYTQQINQPREYSKEKKVDKGTVTKKRNPFDNLMGIANAILRGDYIATLTIIVEMVQKQDTNLLVKVLLIFLHRFLTFIQPLFYALFPSTKDQGSVTGNLKNRLKVTLGLVEMFLKS